MAKTGPLRRAKPEGEKHPSDNDCRWILKKGDYGKFQFDRDEAVILRMADVIRKFLLEFEFLQQKTPLWPWYSNSKYCDLEKGHALYDELMGKFNLIYALEFDEILMVYHEDKAARLKASQGKQEMNQQETYTSKPKCIRHKRKFAAIQLLKTDSERNLNHLRHYLRHYMKTKKKKEEERGNKKEEELRSMVNLSLDHLDANNPKKGRRGYSVYEKPKDDMNRWTDLAYSVDQELKSISFDDHTFPLFKKFMMQYFVDRDYKIFERNENMFPYTQPTDFYRIFIDSWRKVPSQFWKYKHDILLMELVLHKGIKSDAIVEYIGTHGKELVEKYEFTKEIDNATKVDTTKHPLYAFESWCRHEVNVLHRVQHVLKTIMLTLQDSDTKNTELYSIFSSYQRKSHLQFIRRDQWTFNPETDTDEDTDQSVQMENKEEEEQSQATQEDDVPILEKDRAQVRSTHKAIIELERKEKLRNEEIERKERLRIKMDPYVTRDFETELFDSLQAFDLKQYGPIIIRFIIQKLTREPKESYCVVLGLLFYSLPDPVAIEILWKSQYTLQRVKPVKLRELCEHIQ
eukprot:228618_1